MSLDLDIGSSLTQVGVHVATLGKRAFRGRRGSSFGVVGLSSGVCLELRRELRRRRNCGRLGSSGGLELAYMALVCVSSLTITNVAAGSRQENVEQGAKGQYAYRP